MNPAFFLSFFVNRNLTNEVLYTYIDSFVTVEVCWFVSDG